MSELLNAKEAAERAGYDYRYFRELLNDGKVPGATKTGRMWRVPADSEVFAGHKRPKLSEETGRKMEEMILSDIPAKAIASKLGVASSTVYKTRRELLAKLAEERKQLVELLEATASKAESINAQDGETVGFHMFQVHLRGADFREVNWEELPSLVDTRALIDTRENVIYIPMERLREYDSKREEHIQRVSGSSLT